MKEFLMIFRNDYNPEFMPSPEQIEASIKKWKDWIKGIAVQGKFIDTNRLSFKGKTLKANNVIVDGPYMEIKEIVGGYILIKEENINRAIILAEGCPILNVGGSVEVREIMDV